MFRYFCAGTLSVAIHFLIFAPLFEQPAMALPVKQQPQSVSLQFKTVTKPAPKKVETPPQQVKTEPPVKKQKTTPKKVETTKKRLVKEKTKPQKIKKETPKIAKKVEKKKPVVKKTEPKKIIEPPKEVIPTPAQKVAAVTPATQKKVTEDKKQVAQQNEGLQEKPQLIQKSRFLSKPNAPKYPRLAKRKGIEGTVTYEVWLDEKGKQVKLLLKNSSGAKMLDLAALKAIKTWKFSPHSINGKSIAHRIYVPISFQLD
ncbi:energy transducer TonB [Psychromonas sp. RZ22]|uniref:energy transducer TonB n=1 Tax=Psychromonas algarum TaxID=2555643 RepID=UPI001067973A|nr:energy transducer TonB [Psychromonas sp. RZ22]TEW54161.1 energy transducer TonB [Psychromonas sp. RZ22]